MATDFAHAYGYKIVCRDEHVLTATSERNIDGEFFDALFAWAKEAGFAGGVNGTKPTKAIINDPATVVFFDDNSKVVTKATCGDEYDPLFGIMACALRKVGKNRVTIDLWEPVIGFLADFLADADECRLIADMLTTTADALELDGVMDAIEDYDSRTTEPDITERIKSMSERIDEDIRHLDEALHERERTRQTIRNLVDRGEL
jgi:hypothetical protein